MPNLQPGEDWEPLPDGEMVFRLAIPSMDGQTLGGQLTAFATPPFRLSPKDKEESPPRVSVWASSLTTPRQAWKIMGQHLKHRILLRLHVAIIRSLRVDCDVMQVPTLDVVWHPIFEDSPQGRIPDSRPGAAGHSGITNLDPDLYKGNRIAIEQVKSLRSELADKADYEPFSPDSDREY